MPQSHMRPEPSLIPVERPRCPRCQNRMMFAFIMPGPPGYDVRNFECVKCDHIETRMICKDPMKAGSAGWANSDLNPRSKTASVGDLFILFFAGYSCVVNALASKPLILLRTPTPHWFGHPRTCMENRAHFDFGGMTGLNRTAIGAYSRDGRKFVITAINPRRVRFVARRR
jgi:hypothetical protein